ncbi:MAG: hypothetical protein FRX49_03076 [Trebouxia sp. A1-2]|nr:MAG: hypothetical protein FRX49_03076 [Trebouxia sp. A1-2]
MYLQASLVQVGREWARRTKALAKPMVIPQNKVLDVLADGDALLMQPPNSRCGQWFLKSNMLSQLASVRAHNLILQPAITINEFTAHVAAAPSAWVGAAGGSPLRDQGLAPVVNIQPDRESEPRLLIIGPEGDFTMAELNMLTHHGAQLISLGSLRLRVETAALAMLSAAQLLI